MINALRINSSPQQAEGLLSGDYWAEMRQFLAVARTKSFNKAAELIGVSHPTVSRNVRRLEDQLGAQLLLPTQRGVKLTERGEELARSLAGIDQSFYSIAAELSEHPRLAEANVRVSITDGLNAFFAAPAIEEFSKNNPNIHLHMKSTISLSELRDNHSDMMLSFSPAASADVTVKRLGSLHFRPTVSRGYVEKYGLPTLSNIQEHRFLQSHFYLSDAQVWADWLALVARGKIAHHCDDTFVYGIMVKLDLGIGLLGTYTAAEPEAVPLDLNVLISLPLYAICLNERLRSRPVKIVFKWLCEIFGPNVPWFRRDINLAAVPPTMTALRVLQSRGAPGEPSPRA
jgi:DNA-binding transcriptional LysR family regulator